MPSLCGPTRLSSSPPTSSHPATASCSTSVPCTSGAGHGASMMRMLACEEGGDGFELKLVCHCGWCSCVCSWSPDTIWPYDVVVQWNGESFKGEGLQNVAIPCDSSQECFYVSYLTVLYMWQPRSSHNYTTHTHSSVVLVQRSEFYFSFGFN